RRAVPGRDEAHLRLVPDPGAAPLPPGHPLRVVSRRPAGRRRRGARDHRGTRTGLPDVLLHVVAQTGLVAGRFADRRVPADRAEDLRRRVAAFTVNAGQETGPVAIDPIAAVRRALGDPQPLATDRIWQKPFDYDTGHLHRLAALPPGASAEPADLVAYALDFTYEKIQKDLFLHVLP